MPKRKTELQIKNILSYYDERKASGSKSPQLETASKYKITRQTVSNYVKKRNNPSGKSKKENTNITIREIIAEKELDKQFNEESGGRIENVLTENVTKHLFEKYPKKAKEILDKNYEWALQQTFNELEKKLPSKDLEALREGYDIKELLSEPLTLSKRAKEKEAEANIIEAEKRIKLAESVIMEEEGVQHLIKEQVDTIKEAEEQSNIEESESLYYDANYEEMYDDFMNVYFYVKNPNNNKGYAVQLIEKFGLKWAFRRAQAEEVRQLRVEKEQEESEKYYNRMSDEELSKLFTKMKGDNIDVLTN